MCVVQLFRGGQTFGAGVAGKRKSVWYEYNFYLILFKVSSSLYSILSNQKDRNSHKLNWTIICMERVVKNPIVSVVYIVHFTFVKIIPFLLVSQLMWSLTWRRLFTTWRQSPCTIGEPTGRCALWECTNLAPTQLMTICQLKHWNR